MYKIINKRKLIATVVADIIGNVVFFPKKLFQKREKIGQDIREILLIRTAYIGDVIMTLPILKPLKKLYPNARITFLTGTKAAAVLENNPYIDKILTYDAFWFYSKGFKEAINDYWRFLKVLRSKPYDLVIEARADIRDILLLAYLSKGRYRVSYKIGGGGYLLTHVVPFKKIKHRIDYHLDIVKFLGASVDRVEWDINLSPEEEGTAETLLSQEGVTRSDLLIGIHPGGRKGLKCWPYDRFAQVADYLISEYVAKIIFTGSIYERGLIEDIIKDMNHKAVNLAGETDLRLLAGLIERFNLFICNDSATLHIASAMKTPTVTIFGPSKSKETGPYGNIHKVVEKDFPCRYRCDENICRHKVYNECMVAITPGDVCNAVKDIIETKITKPKNLLPFKIQFTGKL